MCGICGEVTQVRGLRANPLTMQRMNTSLRHRGPDDEGYFADDFAALAMRRLSIIDLDRGQQPISNEDRTIWLVFNGEIYNYREVRKALIAKGHRFRSRGDAEVVVHAYEEYGLQCVNEFNGMFAFALWDSTARRLVLMRDRIGIKPLFYYHTRDRLIFASEIKALLLHSAVPVEVNPHALDLFLTYEYIPSPHTIYQEIAKLEAGHYLVYEAGSVTVRRYWEPKVIDSPGSEAGQVERLRDLLASSVKLRLVSDVPLGAFLSGGIDSSSIVACMREVGADPIRTFSIGFNEIGYDESIYARLVANEYSTDHTAEILNPEICSLAERLVSQFDEPFADFSIFPTYLVSELASDQVKVALSGDGGDELFAGYDTYAAHRFDRCYRLVPASIRTHIVQPVASRLGPRPEKKGLTNILKRFVDGASQPAILQHVRWMSFLREAERSALYEPGFLASLGEGSSVDHIVALFEEAPFETTLARQQYVDVRSYLVDDILAKVDRMSMATSLEVRVPFLDHRIVEFALNLPERMKMRSAQRKVILRKAMGHRLPAAVIRRPKQGFSAPMKLWLRESLRPLMLDVLSADSLRRRGYFRPAFVGRLLREHQSGTHDHSHKLWALMVFELWHRSLREKVSLQFEAAPLTPQHV